jgi:hypothetical protein
VITYKVVRDEIFVEFTPEATDQDIDYIFWVRYIGQGGPVQVTVEGAQAAIKGTHELEIQLYQGWNQIGNPFLDTPLSWDDDRVRIRHTYISRRMLGLKRSIRSDIRPLGEAISKGWIHSKIFIWNSDTASYEIVEANRGTTIPVGKGFWLYCHKSSTTTTLIMRRQRSTEWVLR